MILENIWYVERLSYRYNYVHIEREDLVQEGILSLYRAKDNYDSRHGLSFISYAHLYILDSMNRYIKKNSREDNYEEIPESDYDPIEGYEYSLDLIGRLSKEEKEILYYKLQGKSNRDIGNILGYSGEWIRKSINRMMSSDSGDITSI